MGGSLGCAALDGVPESGSLTNDRERSLFTLKSVCRRTKDAHATAADTGRFGPTRQRAHVT